MVWDLDQMKKKSKGDTNSKSGWWYGALRWINCLAWENYVMGHVILLENP